jgi:hypothetical protein
MFAALIGDIELYVAMFPDLVHTLGIVGVRCPDDVVGHLSEGYRGRT